MEKLIIHGGKTLKGEVNISGAKNSALPLMAASLLAPGAHQLTNVPSLRDVTTMISLLSHLGIECQQDGDKLTLQHTKLTANNAPYDLVRTMRASVLVMGPLLAKFRHAKISLPGGCAIGARPIDLHLKALEQMGAKVELHDGYVEVFADKLHSATIHFDKITVTGTENIMMAAVFTNGKTLLKNAAREPEIIDLANYLNKMGAKITGAGTDCISIEGVNELTASSHSVIADRIEAGTFIIAAGITGSEITLQNCPTALLETEIAKLKTAGLCFEPSKNSLLVKGPKQAISVNMSTQAHPGFATDLQAQFMALMSVANSTSVITENIFPDLFIPLT